MLNLPQEQENAIIATLQYVMRMKISGKLRSYIGTFFRIRELSIYNSEDDDYELRRDNLQFSLDRKFGELSTEDLMILEAALGSVPVKAFFNHT